MTSSNPLKGFVAVALGVGLGAIGSDVVGNARFVFGHPDYFYDGVSVVIIATGIFCIPELWELWKTKISLELIFFLIKNNKDSGLLCISITLKLLFKHS